jgi:hypothetical protein
VRSIGEVYGVGGASGSSPVAQPRGQRAALPWEAVLDALEERTRGFAAVVEGDEEAELPDVSPLLADGPLPPHLELRARVLLAETSRLAEVAEKRRDAVKRTLHYNKA